MKDARACAVALQREAWGLWFNVNVESHESIREDAAFAEVEWQR